MAIATDPSFEKIQALVKEKPELSSTVSAKLSSLLAELEVSESSTKATTNFDKINLGFQKFKKDIYEKNPELISKLKKGQWPKFMVIACADSRVDPSIILGLKPGDAFIVRNIANMIPPFETEGYPSVGASLEYAVLHLKAITTVHQGRGRFSDYIEETSAGDDVEHIIVLGHRACGGVGALVTMTPDDGKYSTTFIEKWVAIGKPARAEVKSQLPNASTPEVCKTCEKESVNNSLKNLLTYPFVVDATSQQKVSLHGGYYDFLEGSFETWDFDVPSKKA